MRMKLVGQSFEVLRLLLENPQQIVTRETLRQHLWPENTHVEHDLALKRVVNRLRAVLGDSAESPHFIETIPRLGYRFIAPVTIAGNGSRVSGVEGVSAASPVPARGRRRLRILGVSAVLLSALLAVAYGAFRKLVVVKRAPPSNIHSLAVLPLANLSADPSQEYFSDGLTDALITEIAQIGSVKVISRTSIEQYKKTTEPLSQIARDLNVDGIVEGTVQRAGDQVRVSVQLVDGRHDQHIWAASYERSVKDILTLERNLTLEIAGEIQAQLTNETQAKLAMPQPVNSKALEAYWQGKFQRQLSERGVGDEARRRAAVCFRKAIAADPNFAPAYVGLAYAYFRNRPGDEDLDIMTAAAEKAVALDPKLAEARIALGDAKWASGAWAEAEQQFRMSIALNPNDAVSHGSLCNILDVTGRFDEGLREAEIAQALDPENGNPGWFFYRRRQYDRAIDVLRAYAQSHPGTDNHWGLAQIYLQKRMTTEWVAEVGTFMASGGFPEVAGHLHRAAAVGGYKGALRQWTKELERLQARKQLYWPGVLAQAYAMLGEKEQAFHSLEDAYTHRRRAYTDPYLWGGLRVDPGFDSLRSDPRYQNLLSRLGLPL
jgi:TolB-like protein/Tfp pilus assembly protein PilF